MTNRYLALRFPNHVVQRVTKILHAKHLALDLPKTRAVYPDESSKTHRIIVLDEGVTEVEHIPEAVREDLVALSENKQTLDVVPQVRMDI